MVVYIPRRCRDGKLKMGSPCSNGKGCLECSITSASSLSSYNGSIDSDKTEHRIPHSMAPKHSRILHQDLGVFYGL